MRNPVKNGHLSNFSLTDIKVTGKLERTEMFPIVERVESQLQIKNLNSYFQRFLLKKIEITWEKSLKLVQTKNSVSALFVCASIY